MSESAERYDEAVMSEWTKMGNEEMYKRIMRLQRNQELLRAFICARVQRPSAKTIVEMREYLDRNQGFPEEF